MKPIRSRTIAVAVMAATMGMSFAGPGSVTKLVKGSPSIQSETSAEIRWQHPKPMYPKDPRQFTLVKVKVTEDH